MTSKAAAEIRRWLNKCQDEHDSCPRRCEAPLPRRVLDLEASTLRLRLSSPNEKGAYATLSYCWGGVIQLITTATNIQEHVQAIDPASLPRTITDGIEVCCAIG